MVAWERVPWWWLLVTALLIATGIAFVASATQDPLAPGTFGREFRLQLTWLGISIAVFLVVLQFTPAFWRQAVWPAYVAALLVVIVMALAAGTTLVPRIKGQANWIALGSWRIQPVEFVKIATLLALATLATAPGFDARRIAHLGAALLIAAIPAALIAREDLGSALTFVPMALGLLVAAGMRLSHLGLGLLVVGVLGAGAVAALPKEGDKAYQWKRIQAWLHPEDYRLTEGYQTDRAMRSIGSGQWTGKGWGEGDQNRLGWLPEKHTDMIFAVVGEEIGFLGTTLVLLLFGGWIWACVYAASAAQDAWGRLLTAGYGSLVAGQASINIAVATGLMPVTGVTLPFFSYGGSSLLGCMLGLAICCAAVAAPRERNR